MENTPNQGVKAGSKQKKIASVVPIYAFGATWLVYAVIFPLHKISQFIMAGVLSTAVFFLMRAFFPAKLVTVEEKVPTTGDDVADAVLRDGRQMVAKIHQANDAISSHAVSQKIEEIEATCGKIFDCVQKNPAQTPMLRRFMNYYMPTLLKLLNTYANLETQGIKGENISQAMERIEGMLGTISTAFTKQLDALFGDTALDISTDITVMENMLAREGLSDGTQKFKL